MKSPGANKAPRAVNEATIRCANTGLDAETLDLAECSNQGLAPLRRGCEA